MFDLDTYLARIGLRGRPTIAEVHRAHLTSIPFENLDPYCGIPVSLALDDLERKLVSERRGGYCFEQNLLLKAALEALGAQVDLLLARVRVGAAPGVTRPRTHLVLRVRAGGAVWHADVGFGLGSSARAAPVRPRWRACAVGLALSRRRGGRRARAPDGGRRVADLYAFPPYPVPFVDVETSNWFTSTHPRSPFVTGVIVSAHADDGSRSMLRTWDEASH